MTDPLALLARAREALEPFAKLEIWPGEYQSHVICATDANRARASCDELDGALSVHAGEGPEPSTHAADVETRPSASPRGEPAPITTEGLDKLQFGRVLHKRPANNAGEAPGAVHGAQRDLYPGASASGRTQPVPDDGWRDISTAPRHYTPLLLRDGSIVGEGWYSSHLRCWEFANPAHVMRRKPTHWRPLPPPPERKE